MVAKDMERKISPARDAWWLFIAALVLAWVLFAVVTSVADSDLRPHGLALLFQLAVISLPAYWLLAGAWRRTRWGQRRRPFARLDSEIRGDHD